jgi:hypothetical protein
MLRLRLGDCLDLGLQVDGDLGELAVVAFEFQGLLMAIRRLSPHLNAADRPTALMHDNPFDLSEPAAMTDAHALSHSQPGSGGILG